MSVAVGKVRPMREVLYEAPGPRTRRMMRYGTVISILLLLALAVWVVFQFYKTGQLDSQYWYFFLQPTTWIFLAKGMVGTVQVALCAGALALCLGFLLMLGRISSVKPLSVICRVIIDFLRGMPSLLLIYFFFLVLPQYQIRIPVFWMLALPVALAASGVLAEVFRAGVNAVPKGQVEAAVSLGLRPSQTMFLIVAPQAIRYVIPSLVSQLVAVVKDTTVAYVVSYPDLMQNARVLITNYDALVSMYFVTALIYILINFAINQVAIRLSQRMGSKIIR